MDKRKSLAVVKDLSLDFTPVLYLHSFFPVGYETNSTKSDHASSDGIHGNSRKLNTFNNLFKLIGILFSG